MRKNKKGSLTESFIAFSFACRPKYWKYTPGSLNLLAWAGLISVAATSVWNAEQAPPKTTLWFVSLRQWSCTSAARPGGSRVFGQSADPSLIFHCCAHFIEFPVGCTGQFLTLRCDVLSYKSPMNVRAPARRRLVFQKEFASVKPLRLKKNQQKVTIIVCLAL